MFIFELQNGDHQGFIERLTLYASEILYASAQTLSGHSHDGSAKYENLRMVNIYAVAGDLKLIENDPVYFSFHPATNTRTHERNINAINTTVIELLKFNIPLAKSGQPIQPLLTNRQRWAFALLYSSQLTGRQMYEYYKDQPIFLRLFEQLAILNLNTKERHIYERLMSELAALEFEPHKKPAKENLETERQNITRMDQEKESAMVPYHDDLGSSSSRKTEFPQRNFEEGFQKGRKVTKSWISR
jgi:hypothetical protein